MTKLLLIGAATAATMTQIISYGFLLGMGFYGSRKLADKIDEQLILRDKDLVNSLKESVTNGRAGTNPAVS
jgi:hypothetical protein